MKTYKKIKCPKCSNKMIRLTSPISPDFKWYCERCNLMYNDSDFRKNNEKIR